MDTVQADPVHSPPGPAVVLEPPVITTIVPAPTVGLVARATTMIAHTAQLALVRTAVALAALAASARTPTLNVAPVATAVVAVVAMVDGGEQSASQPPEASMH